MPAAVDQRADAVCHAHGDRAADHVAHDSRAGGGPAWRRARRTGSNQGSERGDDGNRDPRGPRRQRDGQQRQHRPGHEDNKLAPAVWPGWTSCSGPLTYLNCLASGTDQGFDPRHGSVGHHFRSTDLVGPSVNLRRLPLADVQGRVPKAR